MGTLNVHYALKKKKQLLLKMYTLNMLFALKTVTVDVCTFAIMAPICGRNI